MCYSKGACVRYMDLFAYIVLEHIQTLFDCPRFLAAAFLEELHAQQTFHTKVHVYTEADMHTFTYTYAHIYIYIHTYVHIHMQTYAHVCVCTYIYIYIHVYMYIYICIWREELFCRMCLSLFDYCCLLSLLLGQRALDFTGFPAGKPSTLSPKLKLKARVHGVRRGRRW